MITYKVIKTSDNPEEVEIEKAGSVHTYTVGKVHEQLAQIEKQVKELSSQKELEDAKMANYKSFHPIIETLTEEQVTAIGLYYEALKISKFCEERIASNEAAVKEFDVEKAEIEVQTGIKI